MSPEEQRRKTRQGSNTHTSLNNELIQRISEGGNEVTSNVTSYFGSMVDQSEIQFAIVDIDRSPEVSLNDTNDSDDEITNDLFTELSVKFLGNPFERNSLRYNPSKLSVVTDELFELDHQIPLTGFPTTNLMNQSSKIHNRIKSEETDEVIVFKYDRPGVKKQKTVFQFEHDNTTHYFSVSPVGIEYSFISGYMPTKPTEIGRLSDGFSLRGNDAGWCSTKDGYAVISWDDSYWLYFRGKEVMYFECRRQHYALRGHGVSVIKNPTAKRQRCAESND